MSSLKRCTAAMSMPSKEALTPNSCAFAGLVCDLTRVQEGLGGDAPVVQAGAPQLVSLDHRRAQAELGTAQRGGVTGTAAAEDYEVEAFGGFRHVGPSPFALSVCV